MSTIGSIRLPVFVSYAHDDNEATNKEERWSDRLLEMLKPLRLDDKVCAWSDKDIATGVDWKGEIEFQLNFYAEAAVLLISPAYLASDFIRNSELPVLLRRGQEQNLLIIPIILRHCLFSETTFNYPDPKHGPQRIPFSGFQTINNPDNPFAAMSRNEQDKVFADVGRQLLQAHGTRRIHEAS